MTYITTLPLNHLQDSWRVNCQTIEDAIFWVRQYQHRLARPVKARTAEQSAHLDHMLKWHIRRYGRTIKLLHEAEAELEKRGITCHRPHEPLPISTEGEKNEA